MLSVLTRSRDELISYNLDPIVRSCSSVEREVFQKVVFWGRFALGVHSPDLKHTQVSFCVENRTAS